MNLRKPIIAALLSAFVFPGAGFWYLGQFGMMLVFAVPTLFALGWLLKSLWSIAEQAVLAETDLFLSRLLLSNHWDKDLIDAVTRVKTEILASPNISEPFWILITAWLLGIILSYSQGLRDASRQPPSTPQQ